VDTLLTQQLREPHEERRLREALPRLTPIEDDVSLKVQRQYEENPYPRWIKIAPPQKTVSLDDFVRKMLPHAPVRPTEKSDCDILVAGCGTGQEPLGLAQNVAGAKILAVDLSLSSLSHAKRKTLELDVRNIDYAQGDILKLATLGRNFDLVVTSGVLHHMADPLSAWRDLLTLVRPGGFMVVGLYSEAARQPILAAREFVAAHEFQATADDIRRARHAIMSLPDGSLAKRVSSVGDFFSISECRDLLFHAQERCLTIPQIKNFIDESGVRFLGFRIGKHVVGQYVARFPQDSARTDLNNWHAFEMDHPDTFIAMYHFVIQRPPTIADRAIS
jgi:2-polyprenyl-3-methyl-5-hydroxy-6-metoxy-1,4-benzoquinol methylase